MSETATTSPAELVGHAAAIVSAYVSRNSLPAFEIPALLAKVHAGLVEIATGTAPAAAPEPVEKPTPAEIRKSIGRETLTSFIDGKPYKTLKRHLTKHGLEPGSYRARYGLPADYPMTAPGYSDKRSALAKATGLGQKAVG